MLSAVSRSVSVYSVWNYIRFFNSFFYLICSTCVWHVFYLCSYFTCVWHALDLLVSLCLPAVAFVKPVVPLVTCILSVFHLSYLWLSVFTGHHVVPCVYLCLTVFPGVCSALHHQYYFVNKSLSWSEAQSHCRQYGSELATVHGPEDQGRLVEVARK